MAKKEILINTKKFFLQNLWIPENSLTATSQEEQQYEEQIQRDDDQTYEQYAEEVAGQPYQNSDGQVIFASVDINQVPHIQISAPQFENQDDIKSAEYTNLESVPSSQFNHQVPADATQYLQQTQYQQQFSTYNKNSRSIGESPPNEVLYNDPTLSSTRMYQTVPVIRLRHNYRQHPWKWFFFRFAGKLRAVKLAIAQQSGANRTVLHDHDEFGPVESGERQLSIFTGDEYGERPGGQHALLPVPGHQLAGRRLRSDGSHARGRYQRMRKLRGQCHTFVEKGRHWTLPL